MAQIGSRVLKSIHSREQVRIGVVPTGLVQIVVEAKVTFVNARLSLGVPLVPHVAAVVRGFLIDPYMPSRRLLGLYLGPLREVVAQAPDRVVTVPLSLPLRLTVARIAVTVSLRLRKLVQAHAVYESVVEGYHQP